jgi:hypothetical protein
MKGATLAKQFGVENPPGIKKESEADAIQGGDSQH